MTDQQRIERLEMAFAALAELLQPTNPHIVIELQTFADVLGGPK